MLPSESESEKPLLQLSYAVIVPKVFANSSSDKCSSVLETMNCKVCERSGNLSFSKMFSSPSLSVLLLLHNKCFPFPNISLYFPLRPSSPSLIRCFLSRNLFQLHKKNFASKCFPIRYFLYKNIFFLFRHRYLSSKRQNIFLPFLLHYSYIFFFSSSPKI